MKLIIIYIQNILNLLEYPQSIILMNYGKKLLYGIFSYIKYYTMTLCNITNNKKQKIKMKITKSSKKRTVWDEQSDEKLFQCHVKYGPHWKLIAAQFIGLSENNVKNRFFANIRKKLRQIRKLMGNKNSSQIIKNIQPTVISNFLITDSQDQNSAYQIKKFINFILKFNGKNHQKEELIDANNMIDKLIVKNQVYLKEKRIKKQIQKDGSDQQNLLENSGLTPQTKDVVMDPNCLKNVSQGQNLLSIKHIRSQDIEEISDMDESDVIFSLREQLGQNIGRLQRKEFPQTSVQIDVVQEIQLPFKQKPLNFFATIHLSADKLVPRWPSQSKGVFFLQKDEENINNDTN